MQLEGFRTKVEGMVHISQICEERVQSVSDKLTVGDVVKVRVMEIDIDDVPWKDDLVSHPPVIENGQLVVPTRPGWGADVNEDAIKAHPVKA